MPHIKARMFIALNEYMAWISLFLLIATATTVESLAVSSVRSRIPLPLSTYESVVRRIHTPQYYPCAWFDIDNATDFRRENEYCTVRYACKVRGPPPRLVMEDIGSIRMFTSNRDKCKMLFINKTGNPLMLACLLVRPIKTGGCCIDLECRLMEDPDIGGLLACALVMALRKNERPSLMRVSRIGEQYAERALGLPKAERGNEPVGVASDYFEWNYC